MISRAAVVKPRTSSGQWLGRRPRSGESGMLWNEGSECTSSSTEWSDARALVFAAQDPRSSKERLRHYCIWSNQGKIT